MDLQARLPGIVCFCAAYEVQSYSKAARSLGMTPQAVSRSVAKLEQTLGSSLFRRTTRSLTPTPHAEAFYRRAHAALELLSEAEHTASADAPLHTGLIRLSTPTTFGHSYLLPSLARFRDRHPAIRLAIHIGNRNIDFAQESFDCAIRMGPIRSAGLIARKLGDYGLGVFASPLYLARRGAPRTLAELSEHSCIAFQMPSTGRILPWAFPALRAGWAPSRDIVCEDDVLGSVTMARAGLGLVQAYDFVVEPLMRRGELVEVLANHRGATRTFSLVYPSRPKPSPAARLLIDFLLAPGP